MAKKIVEGDPGTRTNPRNYCTGTAKTGWVCTSYRLADALYPEKFRYEKRWTPGEGVETPTMYPEWLWDFGDTFMETVFGAINTAIATATGGLITEYLGDDPSLENLFNQVGENLGEQLSKVIETSAADADKLLTYAMNESAEKMAAILGITKAQQAVADGVAVWIEDTLDVEAIRRKRETEQAEREAEALVEAMTVAADRAASIEFDAADAADLGVSNGLRLAFDQTFNVVSAALDQSNAIALQNQETALTLAGEYGSDAALSFTAAADAQLDSAMALFQTGVVAPVAQAEAQAWAIRAASVYDSEELFKQQCVMMVHQMELTLKLAEATDPLGELRRAAGMGE